MRCSAPDRVHTSRVLAPTLAIVSRYRRSSSPRLILSPGCIQPGQLRVGLLAAPATKKLE